MGQQNSNFFVCIQSFSPHMHNNSECNKGVISSVRMRSEAYGSHFVCVCLFRAYLLFSSTLRSVSTDIIPCFLSL